MVRLLAARELSYVTLWHSWLSMTHSIEDADSLESVLVEAACSEAAFADLFGACATNTETGSE